jgi:peptidyl-prolyl cis-trans isomerase B (cyclophilin B)
MKQLFYISLAVIFLFSIAGSTSKPSDPGDSAKKVETTKKVETIKAETAKKGEMKEYQKRKADNPEIAIDTDFGTMKLEMYRDVAPVTVDSILSLARRGFYDGLTFHRIIDGFMIQGGDPQGNGSGDAGFNLKAEFSSLKHVEGTLSMARSSDPNSASCQFFICLAPAPHLDGKYTIFGQLMGGKDVLHKIGSTKVQGEKPANPVFIRKIRILKDIAAPKAGK